MAVTAVQRIDEVDFSSGLWDVLSVDVFDTLITRTVAQPSHVFAVLEKELVHGASSPDEAMLFEGFARVRLFAERRAREAKALVAPYADITLDEIYTEVRRELQMSFGDSTRIAHREMEIERELVVAVPHTVDAITRARKAGVRVIAVSDNYMSSQQLLSLFAAAGITGFSPEDVFVSCEMGGTKANGHIWPEVVRNVDVPVHRMIHVGDHAEADGDAASAAGISVVIDDRMNRSHRFPINTTPSVLTHSRLEATVRDQLRGSQWDARAVVGGTTAALIVCAQIASLDDALTRDPSARVYFAARDGYLAHRLWNDIRVPQGQPPAEYLHVSRSVLWRTSPNFKPSRLIGPRETLTLSRLAHRLEMPELIDMVDDADADTLLTAQQAWDIIEQHRESVDAVTARHRALAVEYVRQKGLLRPGRHFVVDLGWTGSSLADLAALVHTESGGEAVVEGLFLGLYWDATHIRTRFPMHTFATNDMATGDQQRALLASHAVIEALITAPQGSVVGYRKNGDVVEPVLAEQLVEQHEYARLIGAVCDIASDTARQIVSATHPSGVTLDDVTGDAVWASIMQTIHTPRPEEIELFGSIRLVIAIDHADDGVYLVPRTWPQGGIVDVHDSLLRGHWLRGTVASSQYRDKHAEEIRSMINVWPEVGHDWVALTQPR
jgi:FMN phosphatase YigB (HAD superfamily)